MRTLLRQRNFGLLWFGQLISLTGDWFLFIALPFYIYNLTGSTLATGAMFAAQLLPGLLFGSLAGVFVDRWDRKWVMIVSDVLRGLVLLLLLVVQSPEWLWLIYLTTFLQAAIGQFFQPAKNAVIPQLVDEQDLVPANSLSAVSDSLTRLVGPLMGGVMFAALGLNAVVLADVASFFASAALIVLIVLPNPGSEPTDGPEEPGQQIGKFWREWIDGLRLVRFDRMLGPLFVVLAIFSLADSMLTTLLVAFVKDAMHGGSEQLGWLLASQGVGGLLGGLALTKLGGRIAPARLIATACLVDGLLLLLIFNVPIYELALGIIFLAGIVMVGAIVSINTLLQSGAANEFRGRVFGAFATTQSLMRLVGIVVAGSAAEVVGIIPVLDASAAMWVLAGVLCVMLMPVGERRQTVDDGRRELARASD